MQVIVINSQKGGSGKSMLCKHLAVEAERVGFGPVFLIDTDPQATLTTWHARRKSETPALADLPLSGIAAGLDILKSHGARLCIVDTASGRTDIASDLFEKADFVVFPVKPSDDDLTAIAVTVENIRAKGKPFAFVVTQVKPNASMTVQTLAALSKYGQVASTVISDRTGYRSRYADGQTLTEAEPKGPAAQEIAALWEDIQTCMHDSMQATKEARYHG